MKNPSPAIKSEATLKKIDNPVICPYFYQHHLKDMEKNYAENKSFVVSKKPFSPTVLKSDVQSKLQNLHIYHPPRKKRITSNYSKSSKVSQTTSATDHKDEKLRAHSLSRSDLKSAKLKSFSAIENSYSEESSEDSAYNEGECILSSDSRGSTPQISTTKHHLMKRSLGTNTNDRVTHRISTMQNEKDDIVCIQFLKEITSDILKKNIFTNKALRAVFQQHMTMNKYQLDFDKMQREVNKLQERLGVPLDDQFDDEDFGLGKDIPNTEILEEKEEIVEESSSCKEPPKRDASVADKTDPPDPQVQQEIESEENYSDSFSDLSQSEEEKSENHNLDSEEASDRKELSSSSDSGKDFRKSASNSDVESDLEISEVS